MKSWLDAFGGAKQQVDIPTGLPAELGYLKGSVNLSALSLWFEYFQDISRLTDVRASSESLADLSITGTLAGTSLSVKVQFLAEAPSPADGDPVARVAVKMSLGSVPQFGFLSDVLGALSLNYVVSVLDGFAHRELFAKVDLSIAVSKKVTIGCDLDFTAAAQHYEFTVTSADGISVAEALYALGFKGAESLTFLPAFKGLAVRYDALGSGKFRLVTYPTGTEAGTITWAAAVLPKEGEETARPVVASAMVPLGSKTRLSDLDLLRGQIPVDCDLQVGVQVIYASQKLSTARITDLNAALGTSAAALPDANALEAGTTLAARVLIGDKPYTLLLRKPGGQAPEGTLRAASAAQGGVPEVLGADVQAGGDGQASLKIERTLGPLHLRQIQLRLLPADGGDGQRLVVDLDAAFTALGFELEATGLGLQIELVKDPKVSVVIRGLAASYSGDPLYVMGALVSHPADGTYEFGYDGLVMIKAADWGFMAVGSYARLKGDARHPAYTSLFIFGALEGKIGGPPPVVFTGLALGFGYNSKINLPEADKVPDFPFVKALGNLEELTGTKPGEPISPTKVLENVTGGTNAVVVPANEVMWMAAGLSFSVAEIVDGKSLLTVQFGGDDLVVALLGMLSADFPARSDGSSKAPSVAHLDLGFRAMYEHSKRQFSLTAALGDNSWVFDRNCKLTGGAALYVWFPGSRHEGDFVGTVGGYHPAFKKPDHYPAVPRLGLNWSVSSKVSIKGELYVAVTPKVGMVGGRLEVKYSAGGLRAWLVAYFNVIVWWAPLYFRADIGITIGASYKLDCWLFSVTVRVEIGATLEVWGPPVGGRAHLKVGPFSVTIGFGEGENPAARKLGWKDFRDKQLPKAPITVSALDGLLTDPAKAKQAGRGHWVVSTDGFSFVTQTALPATKVTYNGVDQSLAADPHIGGVSRARTIALQIAPMKYSAEASNASVHTVSIGAPGGGGSQDADLSASTDGWEVTPRYAAVPGALWGPPADHPPDVGAAADGATEVFATGLHVRMPPPALTGHKVDTSIDTLKERLWPGTERPWPGMVNPLQHARSERVAPSAPGDPPDAAFKKLRDVLTCLRLLEVSS
ncbi:hypothetical protein E1287_40370 [Actinomadura sp. KC06]|uniref:DUF6603 domain-containing protein n=1 Tax=Actinomadura sp. KC06 TaxID=2530369 RepID=UPI0010515194|nr:DUF6603 domain-containing protein [Actinomadura sp. KC06]TDD21758.1 hypothetical protein E1287_40370 [Actinomadura sp. KC06]